MYKQEIYAPIGETARMHPLYAGLSPFIGVIILAVTPAIPVFPAMMLGYFGPEGIWGHQTQLLYSLVALTGVSIIAAMLWVRFIENRSMHSMGIRFRGKGGEYLRGFLVGLIMNCAAVFGISLVGGYEIGNWLPAISHVSALAMIGAFLVGFIIQGASEEVLTRGWLNSTLAARFGFPIAVGVTSLLFGALHLMNPGVTAISFANIVLVAIFFSIYAYRERSIMGVCAVHSAWNWIMSVGFGLNVSGIKLDVDPLVVSLTQRSEPAGWLTGGSFGPEGSVITTLVIIVSILLAWRMKQRPLGTA